MVEGESWCHHPVADRVGLPRLKEGRPTPSRQRHLALDDRRHGRGRDRRLDRVAVTIDRVLGRDRRHPRRGMRREDLVGVRRLRVAAATAEEGERHRCPDDRAGRRHGRDEAERR
jgi:hypothetical protein